LTSHGSRAPRILWVTGAIYHGIIRPVIEADYWPSSCADAENEWNYISAALIRLKICAFSTLLYFKSFDFNDELMNDSGRIYLFICCLFNDVVSQNLERQRLGWLINDELDKNCSGLFPYNILELSWMDLRIPTVLHAKQLN